MYSKRAFVHWYVGEGMEEVCSSGVVASVFNFRIFRVNFLRLVKTSQLLRKITKRLAQIPPTLRIASTKGLGVRLDFLFFPFFDATLSA